MHSRRLPLHASALAVLVLCALGAAPPLLAQATQPQTDAKKPAQAAQPPADSKQPAQEPIQTLPSASVEVVRIDVTATEKRRARAGLKREDFLVLEDGKPQPIVQFQAFTRPLPGTPAPAEKAEAAGEEKAEQLPARYVVLAIDDVHMSFEGLVHARKALDRFIDQDLSPEDQVALVTTSGAGAISQEFTQDRAVLRQTLSRLSVQERRAGWSGVPYLTEYQAELIEAGDPTALDAAVQEILASGIEQDAAAAASIAQVKARAITEEAVYNARLVLEALESLCRGLSGLSGRKAVFLLSDGFLTGLAANRGTGFDIRRIVDAATRAAVVIYSLDTRGLVATTPVADASATTRTLPQTIGFMQAIRARSLEATRDAMNALAADTGGYLTEDTNDLRVGLHEMLKDTETYYVLAYEPTNTKRDGSFRKIEVRLQGVKGVKLRSRSGYFAPDDRRAKLAAGGATAQDEARRNEQRRAEITTALHSLAPLDGIPVRLSADYVGLEDGTTQLVVSGNLDVAKLPFVRLHDRRQATLESVAVAFDEEGTSVVTLPTERAAMDLTDADYDKVQRIGVSYQKAIALKPGRYQVRLATREDATGLLGSAWQWVEIPEIPRGKLALSSLFLLQERDSAAPPPAAGEAPDLRPAQALRTYRRGENLYAQIYAYNPKRDAAGATRLFAQAEILKKGVTLGKAAPEAMEWGGPQAPPVPHTSRIRLRHFEPGEYELRMTVSDENAQAMATRRVAFTVVD
jgi:VWFA-related protein